VCGTEKKNAERVREREGASEEEKEREGKTHGSRPRENAKRNASLEVSRNNNKNQKDAAAVAAELQWRPLAGESPKKVGVHVTGSSPD